MPSRREVLSSILSNYPLTEEQKAIVEAEAEQKLLVLAPPGTGKTHTVVARIHHLLERSALQPYQLAVLCFTRAAVGEIMERVQSLIQESDIHDDLRFVSIRTFDSFATLLLISANPEREDLVDAGYNKRIQLAVKALQDPDSKESQFVSHYSHLLVDEIQDLVGVRANFVELLLERIEGGFTLLGDPAQAIYDFARSDSGGHRTRLSLIERVQQRQWTGGLRTLALNINHRSTGEVAQLTRHARAIVLGHSSNNDKIHKLRSLLRSLEGVGSGRRPGQILQDPDSGQICILCRTNGELLRISEMLAGVGVRHYIRPRSDEYALPAWIGRMLGTFTDPYISEQAFTDRWHTLFGNDERLPPARAFHWLKRVEGREAVDLELTTLHRHLHKGYRLPDEADASLYMGNRRVALSTIHAAKGREFEHVVILEPEGASDEDMHGLEEARVLYVAATRAREELSTIERAGIPKMMWVYRDLPDNRRRWLARSANWKHGFMEVGLPDDIASESHVSTWIHNTPESAKRSQELLWQHFTPGTPLFIHKVRQNRNIFFRVRPDRDTEIDMGDFGQLSLSFKKDLRRVLRYLTRSERFSYPSFWNNIRMSRLVTEVLPPYPEKVHEPFATSRFCLGIRIRGMVYIPLK